MTMNIGIIGAGNMGEAIAGALIRSETAAVGNVILSDVDERRLEHLHATYGVPTTDDNAQLFSTSRVVVLAVKPQQMAAVLQGLTARPGYRIDDRKLVISIAAGVRIRQLEETLYGPLDEMARARLPIVRVMPNTPALVLEGMSGMSPNRFATEMDMQQARHIFEAMGAVMAFEEHQMDAVTAMSGSGPAYLFYLAEAMIAAGNRMGLSENESTALTLGTLKGAVRLMEDRREPPESLRRKVTSPGGTTAAATGVLDKGNVQKTIVEAILAARQRSKELSK